MYDYLIVGAGLTGITFARCAADKGKTCLVLDRRDHIGGNIYSEQIEGIDVHKYGPHIFHTGNKKVWKFMNRFASFNHFVYSPLANYKGELYNLPFNMNTFHALWGVNTPKEARDKINRQRMESGIEAPSNLEEQAIFLVGKDIYEKLIKGYTEKQWGKPCKELPASIIKRLPVRFTFDNNYFDHPYQGIPVGGYTKMIREMTDGIEVRLGTDYLKNKMTYEKMAGKIIYTGPIDEYFDYCFGELEYRSLRFETELLETSNYQGAAGINFTDTEVPYTRIVEHKHFELGKGNPEKTVITREYPASWRRGEEPYYPVNDEKNMNLYKKYQKKANDEKKILFAGRLGGYRYCDMDQAIAFAQDLAQQC